MTNVAHEPLLSVEALHAHYGKSHVLRGVSFEVGTGEVVSLLGRNGSGRSTTIKAIIGLIDRTGAVELRADSGICRTCTSRAACYNGTDKVAGCPMFTPPPPGPIHSSSSVAGVIGYAPRNSRLFDSFAADSSP